MIDLQTYALCLLIIVQPTARRAFVASVFSGLTYLHNIHLYELHGFAYYASDALMYLTVMSATAVLSRLDGFGMAIHKICIAAIVLDAAGWAMYMLYLEPMAYNVSFMALYGIAILAYLKRDYADDGGDCSVGDWNNYIRGIVRPGNITLQRGDDTP
jgi:hypothetical protein